MRRVAGSLFGIGSVSAYVLQHARLPTAVVQKGTVITNAAAPLPVCSEPCMPDAVSFPLQATLPLLLPFMRRLWHFAAFMLMFSKPDSPLQRRRTPVVRARPCKLG